MRTWTSTGEQLLDRAGSNAAGHNHTTRDEIEAAISTLVEWQDLPESYGDHLWLPAVQGLAIRAIIEQLDLRAPTAIALGVVPCRSDNEPGELLYGLYGIRNRYKDGVAEVFVVDRGGDLIPVASDFLANA